MMNVNNNFNIDYNSLHNSNSNNHQSEVLVLNDDSENINSQGNHDNGNKIPPHNKDIVIPSFKLEGEVIKEFPIDENENLQFVFLPESPTERVINVLNDIKVNSIGTINSVHQEIPLLPETVSTRGMIANAFESTINKITSGVSWFLNTEYATNVVSENYGHLVVSGLIKLAFAGANPYTLAVTSAAALPVLKPYFTGFVSVVLPKIGDLSEKLGNDGAKIIGNYIRGEESDRAALNRLIKENPNYAAELMDFEQLVDQNRDHVEFFSMFSEKAQKDLIKHFKNVAILEVLANADTKFSQEYFGGFIVKREDGKYFDYNGREITESDKTVMVKGFKELKRDGLDVNDEKLQKLVNFLSKIYVEEKPEIHCRDGFTMNSDGQIISFSQSPSNSHFLKI